MRWLPVIILWLVLASCSMLADLGMSAISPDKGGIDTEIVVGDKEQVLGTNQDVKANSIGKVTGTSDNSTAVASAQEVQINNNAFPAWGFALLLILAGLVGWLAPRPQAWKRLIKGNTHDN